MSEWKTYKLGDICTKIGSGATPSGGKEAYKGGDYNLVRSQNVLDFSFSCEGLAQINEEQATKLNNVELQANDVLLNITGDSVARTCLVPTYVLPARVNQHVAIVRANKDILDCYYLLYFIQSQKTNLLSLASGGATRNALTKSMIENYEISLPSLSEQKRISSILKSLDDKIESNRKINENLEQQAQALFKSWFIDFEPFKDGKFVDSELGLIPEGWRVNSAETIYKINIGKTPPRKQQQWFSNDSKDVVWVSISDMGNCGTFINDSSEYLTKEAIQKFNIVLVPQNSILLSFKLTIGRIAIANCQLTTNEAIARFTTEDMRERDFLYFYLKNFNYSSLGSTSSIATAVNSKIVKKMPILIPPIKILDAFHKIVYHNLERIRINQLENKRLSILRDTLLPKLMSGEIEV